MKFSILQWNIWCDEDVRNNLRLIKQNEADIICLQEMTVNYPKQAIKNSPKYISSELGYNAKWQEISIDTDIGGKLMLANGIFAKFPIIDERVYWTNNPTTQDGYSNEKRSYVEVDLDIHGNKLTVGTTHMSYTHKFELTDQKQQETDKLLTTISKHKSKFIITGDMNATPGSYTINKLSKNLINLGPSLSTNTWTTKPFSYKGFYENNLSWRLDHIFATKDVKLISTKILQTNYSDHLPIWSEVKI